MQPTKYTSQTFILVPQSAAAPPSPTPLRHHPALSTAHSSMEFAGLVPMYLMEFALPASLMQEVGAHQSVAMPMHLIPMAMLRMVVKPGAQRCPAVYVALVTQHWPTGVQHYLPVLPINLTQTTMRLMGVKRVVLRCPMERARLALLLWPVDALLSLVPTTNLTQMAMPLMGAKLAVLRSPMVHAPLARLRW